MGVKVTGQFEPAGAFSIVDGKDVSGHITGSNISGSATGTGSFGKLLGDGSSLTGISSYTVANSSDNRVLTSVDSSNGNAEANLTFDGSTLGVTGAITSTTTGSFSRVEIGGGGSIAGWNTKLWLKGTTGAATTLHIESTNHTAVSALRFETNGNNWYWAAGGSGQGYFPNKFYLYNEGGSVANPITICNDGKIGLAGRRSPTYDFDIPGTFRATNKSYFENNVLISPNWGRLGVALGSLTAEPSSSLHVRFSLDDTATSDALRNVTQTNVNYHTFVNGLILENTNDAANTGGKVHIRSAGSRAASVFLYGENAGSAGNSRMSLWTESGSAAYERISLESNGNVLFGTTVTKISGSSTSTGSFGHLRGNVITSEDGNIKYKAGTQTFQNAAGSKTMAVFNGANSVDLHYNNSKKFETTNTGVTVSGNLIATGDITAQRLIVSSSVTNMTIAEKSGSTIFGDSTDDTHLFTGSVNITGSATATSFIGDGSQLTGLTPASITTYNSAADNRIITSVNSTTVQGESNLTFDGSLFNVVGGVTASAGITAESSVIRAKRGTNYLEFDSNSNGFNYINTPSGKDIRLAPGGGTVMRIQTGKVSIGNANYAGSEALYVHTNIRSNATSYFGGIEIGSNILRPETGNGLVISGVNQLHVSGSTGKVGIGTTNADKKLHVQDGVAGMADLLLLDNTQNDNGYGVGILFGLTGVGQGRKGGIFFERTASTARGSLHFSTHDEANATNVDKTDASLTITKEGNIIVPKGNVSGSSTSTGSFGKLLGDASDLSNLPASYTVANSSNNRVLTSVDSTNANAEANLVFDGNNLGIGETDPDTKLEIAGAHVSGKGLAHIDSTDHAFIALDAAGASHNKGIYFQEAGVHQSILEHQGSGNRLRIWDGSTTYVTIGDSTGDIHTIGDISADGNISGSSTSTGSFAKVELSDFKITTPDGQGYVTYDRTNNLMTLGTNGVDRIYILSNGKVGIGQSTNVLKKFDVVGGHYNSNMMLKGQANSAGIEFRDGSNNIDGYVRSADGVVGLADTGGDFMVKAVNDNSIQFSVTGTEISRVTSTMAISGSSTSTGSFGEVMVASNLALGGNPISNVGTTGANLTITANNPYINLNDSNSTSGTRVFSIGSDNNKLKFAKMTDDGGTKVEQFLMNGNGNFSMGAGAGNLVEHTNSTGGNLTLDGNNPALNLYDNNATSGQRNKAILSMGGALYIGKTADNGTSAVHHIVVDNSGNVEVPVGNISGSLTSTGSFGRVNIGVPDTDNNIGMSVGSTVGSHVILSIYASTSNKQPSLQWKRSDGEKYYIQHEASGLNHKYTSGDGNYPSYMYVDNSQNIGMGGQTSPAHKLDVTGTGRFTGTLTTAAITTTGITSTGNISGSSTSTGSFGRIETAGNLEPKVHNTSNLGSESRRWANIYSADLQLSNLDNDEGNEVDGTKGSWTIQEGSDDLYLLNRRNGKKYKFKLEEIT